jgi:uncharacterized membrane protein
MVTMTRTEIIGGDRLSIIGLVGFVVVVIHALAVFAGQIHRVWLVLFAGVADIASGVAVG